MAKNLEVKKQLVSNITKEIQGKGDINAFVIDYNKLTSSEMSQLKSHMVKADSRLTIVKNTLITRILESLGVKMDQKLEGMNALLITGTDMIAPIKEFFDFTKKLDRGLVRFGIINGNIITSDQVKDLSNLPSKEILIGRILAGFNSPIRGFVYTLNGVQSNFVRALNAIKEKKS